MAVTELMQKVVTSLSFMTLSRCKKDEAQCVALSLCQEGHSEDFESKPLCKLSKVKQRVSPSLLGEMAVKLMCLHAVSVNCTA